MPIRKLGHYSVRTTRLDASRRFYIDVLGLCEGFRPAFRFPGAWLYQGDDSADYGVVHLIGVDPYDRRGLVDYLGDRDDASLSGTGALDHLAFLATDWRSLRGRLLSAGLEFRERTVPDLGLHQVFFQDPSGLTIEMNFPAHEAAPTD